MTLLKPLGLLGLIGIIILIIIYIIRPNFQQKFISSTFIWKLSLKYRKKKLPTSRLRNLLLILCQVLILTLGAAILAQPAYVKSVAIDEHEVIAILDSSASMRTVHKDEKTRFERAVSLIQESSNQVFAENGKISVILADDEASFVVQRMDALEKANLEAKLTALVKQDVCSYGQSDINDALTLSEEILAENPAAKIYLYTDQAYAYVPEGISIVPVYDPEEWNAGILDAHTELDNNYYTFTVKLGYYSTEQYDSTSRSTINLSVKVTNTNPNIEGYGQPITLTTTVYMDRNQEKEIVFITQDNYDQIKDTVEKVSDDSVEYVLLQLDQEIYSYKEVYVTIDTSDDSYAGDNYFYIFNGQKPTLKVQYYSEDPNNFFVGIVNVLKAAFSKTWDIEVTEIMKGGQPILSGYDLYIFEHKMPDALPTDGVVFLVDPNIAPEGSGFKIEEEKPLSISKPLVAEVEDGLLAYIDATKITVSKYLSVTPDGDYDVLLTCDNNPMVMVKNQPNSKVMVMNFDVHYSNLTLLKEFPLLMRNIFGYFFPATLTEYEFEVYEKVAVSGRGDSATIYQGENEYLKISELPSEFMLNKPGTYTIVQALPFSGEAMTQYIFVKSSSAESNIWAEAESMSDPYRENVAVDQVDDWLLYIAAALVALLFIEWWLQSRETM